MQVTPEYLTLMGLLAAGICFLWNKLDQIRKELSEISNHSVTHTVCSERRKECPCVKELEYIKETLKNKQ